jgi:DNA replication initiation complex subunit (GINS family)
MFDQPAEKSAERVISVHSPREGTVSEREMREQPKTAISIMKSEDSGGRVPTGTTKIAQSDQAVGASKTNSPDAIELSDPFKETCTQREIKEQAPDDHAVSIKHELAVKRLIAELEVDIKDKSLKSKDVVNLKKALETLCEGSFDDLPKFLPGGDNELSIPTGVSALRDFLASKGVTVDINTADGDVLKPIKLVIFTPSNSNEGLGVSLNYDPNESGRIISVNIDGVNIAASSTNPGYFNNKVNINQKDPNFHHDKQEHVQDHVTNLRTCLGVVETDHPAKPPHSKRQPDFDPQFLTGSEKQLYESLVEARMAKKAALANRTGKPYDEEWERTVAKDWVKTFELEIGSQNPTEADWRAALAKKQPSLTENDFAAMAAVLGLPYTLPQKVVPRK